MTEHRNHVARRIRSAAPRVSDLGLSHSSGPSRTRAQSGVALVVALILLVIITLVGLAAVNGTILQNKMASNQYDREMAFQAAEAALRVGENQLVAATEAEPIPAGVENCSMFDNDGNPVDPGYENPAHMCSPNPFDDPDMAGFIINVTGANFNAGIKAATQPQYVVQYLGKFLAMNPDAPPKYILQQYYRITARSGNPAQSGDRAVVTLQSTYRN